MALAFGMEVLEGLTNYKAKKKRDPHLNCVTAFGCNDDVLVSHRKCMRT